MIQPASVPVTPVSLFAFQNGLVVALPLLFPLAFGLAAFRLVREGGQVGRGAFLAVVQVPREGASRSEPPDAD
jgi:hypothetical protein